MTLIVLLNALFGISIPLSKVLLAHASPLFLTGTRMGIAGAILLFYERLNGKQMLLNFKRSHIFLYLQVIVFGIFASYAMRFYALQYLPAGKTSFLLNFSPLLSSLYGRFFFREQFTLRQWLGLMIGFVGMIPMLIFMSREEAYLSEFLMISWPELLVFFSAALHSYSWIIIQQLVRDKSVSPSFVNGVTMGCGGILALIFSTALGENDLDGATGTFFSRLAFLIFTSNIICHNLYAYLLRRYSATFLSFSGFLAPLFSVLYGWSFLHEEVTWHFYCSSIVVFCGLFLFYLDERKKRLNGAVPAFVQED